jgi:hypothetical protein
MIKEFMIKKLDGQREVTFIPIPDIKYDKSVKMKWDDDINKYEKHLIMDAIVKFSEEFDGKDAGQISIKDLGDFIDKFIDNKS